MRRLYDLHLYSSTEFIALLDGMSPIERLYARADRLRANSEVAAGRLAGPKGGYRYAREVVPETGQVRG